MDNPELIEVFLPLLLSDMRLYETYVYDHEAPLDCPISAFGALEDEEVSREELAAWYDQTRSRFNIQMFPGDHFFFEWKRKQWPSGGHIKGYQEDNRQNEVNRYRHSLLSNVKLAMCNRFRIIG